MLVLAVLMSATISVSVIDWLLDSDPAIRWQVLRGLSGAGSEDVAKERTRVASEGWGARLLSLQAADGLWDGGALFPANFTRELYKKEGQPWSTTEHTLTLLRL